MEALTLSPDVLKWAANQVGESLESLAQFVVKRARDRAGVLEGRLTSPQAEKVAKLTGVPFGLLFLKKPPEIARPTIPDLRQTAEPTPLSRDFRDVLEDTLRKQQWYVDQLREAGARPLGFVGRFVGQDRPTSEEIAGDIMSVLGFSSALRAAAASTDEYFSLISTRAEAVGVLVMKSGIVKSNTRRPLSVKEFRGFAIVDPLAPLVFINGRDALVASVFTLVHELAHIWMGQSGVSDLGSPALKGIERTCNRVAADVLVPRAEFVSAWSVNPDVGRMAKLFRVSRLVIARRALDLGKVDQAGYDALAKATVAQPRTSTGGSAYRTIPTRNSKRFTAALVKSAIAGETLLREAASLLSVRPETVMELGRRVSKIE